MMTADPLLAYVQTLQMWRAAMGWRDGPVADGFPFFIDPTIAFGLQPALYPSLAIFEEAPPVADRPEAGGGRRPDLRLAIHAPSTTNDVHTLGPPPLDTLLKGETDEYVTADYKITLDDLAFFETPNADQMPSKRPNKRTRAEYACYACKFCDTLYASSDAVRKHCRHRHPFEEIRRGYVSDYAIGRL